MNIAKLTYPLDWLFFAKGAANALFQYNGSNESLKLKLLRLRVRKNEDYISTTQIYDFIDLRCNKLFPLQLVDAEIVGLTPGFLSELDTHELLLMLTEPFGLLITNVLYGSYEKQVLSKHCSIYVGELENVCNSTSVNAVILEIKPKWLYDNTTNYCRNCLLNQVKGYDRHFCPLDLISSSTLDNGIEDILSRIPTEMAYRIEVDHQIPLSKLLTVYLTNPGNVFQSLKEHQEVKNKEDLIINLKSKEDVLERLSLIMTLRDVGLFLKFQRLTESQANNNQDKEEHDLVLVDEVKFTISTHIYDLDLKSNLKYKHWRDTEEQLKDVYNSTNPHWKFCAGHC